MIQCRATFLTRKLDKQVLTTYLTLCFGKGIAKNEFIEEICSALWVISSHLCFGSRQQDAERRQRNSIDTSRDGKDNEKFDDLSCTQFFRQSFIQEIKFCIQFS